MNVIDKIAKDVVIKHICHCDDRDREPRDGESEEHVFTVDGEEFPWWISERGLLVTRLSDTLYSIDVEIMLLDKNLTPDPDRPFHATLSVTYGPAHGIPYIPIIDGVEFPWLLTDDGCQLNFGHKIVPILRLTFLARNVTGTVTIHDQRKPARDIYCNRGDLIERTS